MSDLDIHEIHEYTGHPKYVMNNLDVCLCGYVRKIVCASTQKNTNYEWNKCHIYLFDLAEYFFFFNLHVCSSSHFHWQLYSIYYY